MGARQSGGIPPGPPAGRPKPPYTATPVGYVITSDPGASSLGGEAPRWSPAVAGPSNAAGGSTFVVGYPGPIAHALASGSARSTAVPVVAVRRQAPPPPVTVSFRGVMPPTSTHLSSHPHPPLTSQVIQLHPTTSQPTRSNAADLFPAVGERTVGVSGGGGSATGGSDGEAAAATPANGAPAPTLVEPRGLFEAIQALSLSSSFARFPDLKCSVCHKTISTDNIEMHLLTCLAKPQLIYNEDVLLADKGECSICFDELEKGNTIARLPCLCIYHKSCIDDWFAVSRCCPEHPDS